MLRKDIPESHRVIVRIWLSSSSFSNSFGHVALQTFVGGKNNQGHYISFWPADDAQRCCGKQENHFHTREEDIEYCGQAHVDNTYTFYRLDPLKINSWFEYLLEKSNLMYSLTGSILDYDDEYRVNCSSLVFKLLTAAGLNTMIDHDNIRINEFNLAWLRFIEKSGWMPDFLASSLLGLGQSILRLYSVINVKPTDFPDIMKQAIASECYARHRESLCVRYGLSSPSEYHSFFLQSKKPREISGQHSTDARRDDDPTPSSHIV